MTSAFPRIAMVGSGALGCYYGGRLTQAGADVSFLMRSDLEAVRANGLRVRWPKGEALLKPAKAFGTAEEIGPVDLVIVALKTTAERDYERLVRPLLGPATAVLTLQNGLGADDAFARLFGAERILGALCFICVNRLSPGNVECFRPGSLAFGEYRRPISERLRAVEALFRGAGIATELGDDLALLRWRKLVWNVPFNGLSIAAGGLTTDRLLADPALEAEVRALMDEIVRTATALGHTLPADIIDVNVERTRPMGPYKPSSLIDFLAGREVEVESIWGEPLRAAQQAGVSVPNLERLYERLRG
ncbi:2-dehydropantoate 2-reductase [Nibricoccus sp. IMCC34717]|uniref:2-dehydropantoate 2-reductase n=1 Tax=Nibricoccus sp. IMCC34717 TaxID=3034021 RepID=UPI00384AF9E9